MYVSQINLGKHVHVVVSEQPLRYSKIPMFAAVEHLRPVA